MDRFPMRLLIGAIIIPKNVNKLKRANHEVPRESLLKIHLKVTESCWHTDQTCVEILAAVKATTSF